MFSFSRRRMKLGRVKKVQLSDSAQGFRSPVRPPKRGNNSNNDCVPPVSNQTDEPDLRCSSMEPDINSCSSPSSENWKALSISGEKPTPRFNHAAAVVGNKMIVVGGETGNGLLDDVQVLNFDNFTWNVASSKLYLSPSSLPLKIPAWKGHCLVSWGKKVLLVGGKTDPATDRVSVWVFDTDTECWSLMEVKGDIPVARNGHIVVRASSVLILFGGEDSKRRKLNDLYMFDLKSSTWLPLHCTGTGPSPRSNHVGALYDDKVLLVFGGTSKSRTLNDLYSLDFETMIWSRIKIRGFHPSPRAGCCGVLCGTKWYISGGGTRKKRHGETLVFDIIKVEWSVSSGSTPSSVTMNKGFSLVLVQQKDKDFLVAFGGSKKEPSNHVEVLIMDKNESTRRHRTTPGQCPGQLLFEKRSSSSSIGLATQSSIGSSMRSVDSFGRQNLASVIEQHGSGRKSLSELALLDANTAPGNVSLRKQFHNEEENNVALKVIKSSIDETSVPQASSERTETGTPTNNNIPNLHDNDDALLAESDGKAGPLSTPSSIYQFYETRMSSLIRKNGILEAQLGAALTNREAAEKNLAVALKTKHDNEIKLNDAIKDMESLREKLSGLEVVQEEANSLSNIVHSDNVRLEHDVAFLKAVLDDTQKELHSTRGVLAGERARAFQLQVWFGLAFKFHPLCFCCHGPEE